MNKIFLSKNNSPIKISIKNGHLNSAIFKFSLVLMLLFLCVSMWPGIAKGDRISELQSKIVEKQKIIDWWRNKLLEKELMLVPIQKQFSNKEYMRKSHHPHYIEDPFTGIYYVPWSSQEYNAYFNKKWSHLSQRQKNFLWERRLRDSADMIEWVRLYILEFEDDIALMKQEIARLKPSTKRQPPPSQPLSAAQLRPYHARLNKMIQDVTKKWGNNRKAHGNYYARDFADFNYSMSWYVSRSGTPGRLKVVEEWINAMDRFQMVHPEFPGKPGKEMELLKGEVAKINKDYGEKWRSTP